MFHKPLVSQAVIDDVKKIIKESYKPLPTVMPVGRTMVVAVKSVKKAEQKSLMEEIAALELKTAELKAKLPKTEEVKKVITEEVKVSDSTKWELVGKKLVSEEGTGLIVSSTEKYNNKDILESADLLLDSGVVLQNVSLVALNISKGS